MDAWCLNALVSCFACGFDVTYGEYKNEYLLVGIQSAGREPESFVGIFDSRESAN